jgi:hypothetical protein
VATAPYSENSSLGAKAKIENAPAWPPSSALNKAEKMIQKTGDCLIFHENRCGCFVTVSQLETLGDDFWTRCRTNNLIVYIVK